MAKKAFLCRIRGLRVVRILRRAGRFGNARILARRSARVQRPSLLGGRPADPFTEAFAGLTAIRGRRPSSYAPLLTLTPAARPLPMPLMRSEMALQYLAAAAATGPRVKKSPPGGGLGTRLRWRGLFGRRCHVRRRAGRGARCGGRPGLLRGHGGAVLLQAAAQRRVQIDGVG